MDSPFGLLVLQRCERIYNVELCPLPRPRAPDEIRRAPEARAGSRAERGLSPLAPARASQAGKAAPDHDKLNTKRTLFKSSPLQRGTTDSTTEKNAALQRQEPGRGNREEPVQKFVRGRRERGELLFWNWIHTIPDQV